ncbi:unnamed protein product [Laminaria digitata]
MAHWRLGDIIRGAFFAVPVAVAFNDVVGSPAQVAGRSMQPTLNLGLDSDASNPELDVVWQDKLSISRHTYERGSIVIFRNPFEPKERMVKRLIGIDGDWVRPMGNKHEVLRVPQGHCWVEGDRTGISGDSNQFGPIPLALIEAKATHILWPPSRIGKLNQELPEEHRGLDAERL